MPWPGDGKRHGADDRPAGQPVVHVLVVRLAPRLHAQMNDRRNTHAASPWGVADAARSALTAGRTVTSARISRLPGEDDVAAAVSCHGSSSFASLGPTHGPHPHRAARKAPDTFPVPAGATFGPSSPHSRSQRTAPADVQPREVPIQSDHLFRSNPIADSGFPITWRGSACRSGAGAGGADAASDICPSPRSGADAATRIAMRNIREVLRLAGEDWPPRSAPRPGCR